MRNTVLCVLMLVLIASLVACGDDATRPAPSRNDGTIQGEIGDADFEYEIAGGPGDPLAGPFLLRGSNLHYDDEAGALVVDLTVRNLGSFPVREPIGLTFIRLDPDEVTVLNPDNDVHGDGAAIAFYFANDDGTWTPGETSLPRTVEFGVTKGVSIAFVARLDLGDVIDGGTISGRVWLDGNQNGVMEDGEPGIPGIGIYLFPFSDEEDSTMTREIYFTTTDHDGGYAFHRLRAGGYAVQKDPDVDACFPTTPTQIHVLLVEVDGEVSSYHGANFGCFRETSPPVGPFVGKRVHARGKFYPPDVFVEFSLERVPCLDDSVPQPLADVVDPECVGGRLRGPVTEVTPVRNAFKLMSTWIVTDAMNIPPDIVVGARLDVHVHRSAALDSPWIADSIEKWDGAHEELQGRIDAVEARPDGVIRILVLDTWIALSTITVSER